MVFLPLRISRTRRWMAKVVAKSGQAIPLPCSMASQSVGFRARQDSASKNVIFIHSDDDQDGAHNWYRHELLSDHHFAKPVPLVGFEPVAEKRVFPLFTSRSPPERRPQSSRPCRSEFSILVWIAPGFYGHLRDLVPSNTAITDRKQRARLICQVETTPLTSPQSRVTSTPAAKRRGGTGLFTNAGPRDAGGDAMLRRGHVGGPMLPPDRPRQPDVGPETSAQSPRPTPQRTERVLGVHCIPSGVLLNPSQTPSTPPLPSPEPPHKKTGSPQVHSGRPSPRQRGAGPLSVSCW